MVAVDYAYQRQQLVRLLEQRGIRDKRVLEAIQRVPRHEFVRRHLWPQAYRDFALPLSSGQTISQPWVVARMSELARVEPHHRVLEIGTGSGYQTAVLALLARWVFSLERIGELARSANQRLRAMGVENIKIQTFDGTIGWNEMAPYDGIVVTAGAPGVPQPLLDQLAVHGRLVIPEGDLEQQILTCYQKQEDGSFVREEHGGVAFVPLVGRHGWMPEGE
jgi:protein-L-isoaspartate(D-aspartate) O-methyltransferase